MLSDKIKKNAILLNMEAATKEEALAELVDLLCTAHKLKDTDTIPEAVIRR